MFTPFIMIKTQSAPSNQLQPWCVLHFVEGEENPIVFCGSLLAIRSLLSTTLPTASICQYSKASVTSLVKALTRLKQ